MDVLEAIRSRRTIHDAPYIHWLDEEHRAKRVEAENRLAREEKAKLEKPFVFPETQQKE